MCRPLDPDGVQGGESGIGMFVCRLVFYVCMGLSPS